MKTPRREWMVLAREPDGEQQRARARLEAFAGDVPLEARQELAVALGEALTNAGRYGKGEKVLVWMGRSPHALWVWMQYRTEPFNPQPSLARVEDLLEGGRGLPLIHMLTHARFQFCNGLARVLMVKRLP